MFDNYAVVAILGMFVFGVNTQVFAQPGDSTNVEDVIVDQNEDVVDQTNEDAEQGQLHRVIKEKFIEKK